MLNRLSFRANAHANWTYASCTDPSAQGLSFINRVLRPASSQKGNTKAASGLQPLQYVEVLQQLGASHVQNSSASSWLTVWPHRKMNLDASSYVIITQRSPARWSGTA